MNGSEKTASRMVVERVIDELKDEGKVEFVVSAAAELVGEEVSFTTFKMTGVNNQHVEEAANMWTNLTGRLLHAHGTHPTRVQKIANVGASLGRRVVETDRVEDDRRFWAVIVSSLRGEKSNSLIRVVAIYSDALISSRMGPVGWAVEAFYQAMLTGDKDAFTKLRKILTGEEETPWLH